MTYYNILWHFITFYDILWHIMTYYEILWNIMKKYVTRTNSLFDRFSHGKSIIRSLLNSFNFVFENVYTIRYCAQLWGGLQFSKDCNRGDWVQTKWGVRRIFTYVKNIWTSKMSKFQEIISGVVFQHLGVFFQHLGPVFSRFSRL